MKIKPKESFSEVIRGIQVYKSDLDYWISKLEEQGYLVKIQDDESLFENIEDVANNRGTSPKKLSINATKDYFKFVKISFESRRVYISSSGSDTNYTLGVEMSDYFEYKKPWFHFLTNWGLFCILELLITIQQDVTYKNYFSVMASSMYQNARTDRQYKAATGLSHVEFAALYERFAPLYSPKAPPRYVKQVQPILTDKKEALFFILHYLKAYPTLQNMGTYFGISDAAASAYIELLKPLLQAALHQQETANKLLAKNQAAVDAQFAGVTDLVIDITEIPIERAVNQVVQKEHYSGKKNSTP